jgi:putative ABC transport system permease protein
MSPLTRKALRDLIHIRGQAFAIALVIGAGIALLVMSLSTLESLSWSKETFYDRYGFADVFAHLKRAPRTVAERIESLKGVAKAETRIVYDVTLDVDGMIEPAVGRLISVPEGGLPRLNGLHLRRGRWLRPFQRNEVLVAEPFAEAHGLNPGDDVTAIINGRRQRLKLVGITLSPEYLIQIGTGSLFPDNRRFGVFYMGYEGLAAALDMDEAFNDVSLQLMRGASEPEVIRQLDKITEPYGGIGAYGRDDHVSHQYVSDEIRQLRSMATVAPVIFLSVAAFLLNVVLSRLINTQREQIATLKAFGYSKFEIAKHYLLLVLMIPIVGAILGTIAGAYLGDSMARMYAQFYRFPIFSFQLDPRVVVLAFLVSSSAAIVGTLAAVRRAVNLAPAEAMRPEPPANFRPTLIERVGLGDLLPQSLRIIVRNLERRPIKAALSVLGIALAVSVLILGGFMLDALNYMMDFQFRLTQRHDVSVTLIEPRSHSAIHEIEHLPGILQCQPFRFVPVRLRFGHCHERASIQGIQDNRLYRLMDDNEREIRLPDRGLVLSEMLAKKLHAQVGDRVTVEILEGLRRVHQIPIAALVSDFSGMNAYMRLDAVRQIMQEGDSSSGAYLQVDTAHQQALYHALKETPQVAAVNIKRAAVKSFEDTIAENLLRMRMTNICFATIIAFGVVYNSARISLSERSRELSTLRVIGFTRGEISGILLGELALLTLAAIPPGMLIGYGFAACMTLGLQTEIYRIPLVVERSTFAFAATVVMVAAVISGLIVRRRIDHLDLVAVLKSRD